MIHGENVILSIDGKAIAAAKSCQLDVNQNFIQVCSPVSGRWDSFVPSTIGWSASIDMMIVNMENPQAWLNEMKSSLSPLTMRYYDTELGLYQVGQCYIKSWSNGAQVGSISTFSLQLQGSGELNEPEDTISLTDAIVYSDKRITVITPPSGDTSYHISNYSGANLYAKSIVTDMPCRMKLVRTSGSGYIIAADEATTQSLVSNNSNITNLLKIKGTSSTSYITLPAGSYTFIGNTNTGIVWKIMGVWHAE